MEGHTALPPVHLKGKRKGVPLETARYLPERIDTIKLLGLGAAYPLRPHNVSGVAFTRPTRGVLEEGKATVDADHKVEQAIEGYWLQAVRVENPLKYTGNCYAILHGSTALHWV